MPCLDRILQCSPYVSIIELSITQGGSYIVGNVYDDAESDRSDEKVSLNLKNQRSLPTLREIAVLKETRNAYFLPSDTYLTKELCIAWKKSINWKALTRLDLWNSPPDEFLMIFRAYLPQLKSLKFRMGSEPYSNLDSESLLRIPTQFVIRLRGYRS